MIALVKTNKPTKSYMAKINLSIEDLKMAKQTENEFTKNKQSLIKDNVVIPATNDAVTDAADDTNETAKFDQRLSLLISKDGGKKPPFEFFNIAAYGNEEFEMYRVFIYDYITGERIFLPVMYGTMPAAFAAAGAAFERVRPRYFD